MTTFEEAIQRSKGYENVVYILGLNYDATCFVKKALKHTKNSKTFIIALLIEKRSCS